MPTEPGRNRAVIESVEPAIDGGRFPIKRVVGESVAVEADVFADGHDAVECVLLFRQGGETEWAEAPMTPLVNDRWGGSFSVTRIGRAEFTVLAWVDRFLSWVRDLKKRSPADPDTGVSL
ncbi:MAG TPA: maltotransferase domain-containing protein, partial [Gemmata sp.]